MELLKKKCNETVSVKLYIFGGFRWNISKTWIDLSTHIFIHVYNVSFELKVLFLGRNSEIAMNNYELLPNFIMLWFGVYCRKSPKTWRKASTNTLSPACRFMAALPANGSIWQTGSSSTRSIHPIWGGWYRFPGSSKCSMTAEEN